METNKCMICWTCFCGEMSSIWKSLFDHSYCNFTVSGIAASSYSSFAAKASSVRRTNLCCNSQVQNHDCLMELLQFY